MIDSIGATVRVEKVVIPTYIVDTPEKNPIFLEKRVYQGSSGAVYPHPVIERVFDEKISKTYTAIFLENDYLEIMLLPEIGGRVQKALDKTNGYHFVYYNHVIKPALVGLAGPWISGGIEFNWPQHHRPSTFEPVDYLIEENADGSKTVWFSEIERMFRTKGMVGFTLYPGRAYLELHVQLYNRTPIPQTFLWWANPAVAVNDAYQSIFPPDVHAVMDHGKRDVSSFPIATGKYYKVDYSPGTDISRYKNIPVPTSYMAYHSDFDFVGCYDHDRQAGMMHVANHHLVPGKKQWTWGSGDFGRSWDRQLTDEDGPYIELMCGAFTDNQPDFSWLQPGEEKRFSQVFMPYKLTRGAKNASKEAVINLDFEDRKALIAVYVSERRHVSIQLLRTQTDYWETHVELDPTTAFVHELDLTGENNPPHDFTLRVVDYESKQEIITYTPITDEAHTIPEPAQAALPPEAVDSIEALYLNGLHLEQYRHATYAPEPYYLEALRRDPLDSRCNIAMARLLLRRGKFAEAEAHCRTAITSVTRRNPNPYDGEAFYVLGLALKLQGHYDAAFDAFYKAVWSAAWQDCAYFELARLAARKQHWDEASHLIAQALSRNTCHHQARHLQVALLRRRGATAAAEQAAKGALAADRFNTGAAYEQYLLNGVTTYKQMMRGSVHHYVEIALDYAHGGMLAEAISLLDQAPQDDAMVGYYAGWFHALAGNSAAAAERFAAAARMSPDYCFPNRYECVLVLHTALEHNPTDAYARYYLGNFWYAHRRYEEAIACWEESIQHAPDFPTSHRNLGLAYMNKRGDAQAAIAAYERAFELNQNDARVFFELDQLHKRMGTSNVERLSRLEQHYPLVQQRDDLTIELLSLLNAVGRHAEALEILQARTFHPWEGGEGKVTGLYILTLLALARQHLQHGAYAEALQLLQQARYFPPNLGEGKLAGARENHILYFMGLAYEGLGQSEQARAAYHDASHGDYEPASPMYYNDQPPDMIFYQGLAQRNLGNENGARTVFEQLVSYGEAHKNDDVVMDYFAVSLPDFLVFDVDLKHRNRIHCLYMLGLGHLGLNDFEQTRAVFEQILQVEPHHLGVVFHLNMLQQLRKA